MLNRTNTSCTSVITTNDEPTAADASLLQETDTDVVKQVLVLTSSSAADVFDNNSHKKSWVVSATKRRWVIYAFTVLHVVLTQIKIPCRHKMPFNRQQIMKASNWCTWTTFLYVFTESDTAVIASIFVVGIVAALASCAGICFCCICTCQRIKQIGSRWENRFGYILCMTLCNTTTGIFAGAPSTHLASRYHRTSALNSQLFLISIIAILLPLFECVFSEPAVPTLDELQDSGKHNFLQFLWAENFVVVR